MVVNAACGLSPVVMCLCWGNVLLQCARLGRLGSCAAVAHVVTFVVRWQWRDGQYSQMDVNLYHWDHITVVVYRLDELFRFYIAMPLSRVLFTPPLEALSSRDWVHVELRQCASVFVLFRSG